VGQHDEFWISGGPGGHHHHGRLPGLALPQFAPKQLRILDASFFTRLQDVLKAVQPGVPLIVPTPHSGGIYVYDFPDEGKLIAGRQELIDLLLILYHDVGRLNASQTVDQFRAHGGGEKVECDGAKDLGPKFTKKPLGVIVRDQTDVLTPLEAKGLKAECKQTSIVQILLPVVRLPNTIGLFTQGGCTRPKTIRLFRQDLRQGVPSEGIQGLIVSARIRTVVDCHRLLVVPLSQFAA